MMGSGNYATHTPGTQSHQVPDTVKCAHQPNMLVTNCWTDQQQCVSSVCYSFVAQAVTTLSGKSSITAAEGPAWHTDSAGTSEKLCSEAHITRHCKQAADQNNPNTRTHPSIIAAVGRQSGNLVGERQKSWLSTAMPREKAALSTHTTSSKTSRKTHTMLPAEEGVQPNGEWLVRGTPDPTDDAGRTQV
jgi:hypothetical protein